MGPRVPALPIPANTAACRQMWSDRTTIRPNLRLRGPIGSTNSKETVSFGQRLINRVKRSLTRQCALIFGEALEFVIDVKEPLQESAKFTLGLRLQLRLE